MPQSAVKGKGPAYHCSHVSRSAAFYNLGSSSWLGWADSTTVHYSHHADMLLSRSVTL